MHDIQELKLPANERVNIVDFLVDSGTVGEWNLQGLPSHLAYTGPTGSSTTCIFPGLLLDRIKEQVVSNSICSKYIGRNDSN